LSATRVPRRSCLKHTARIADDIAIVKTVATDVFNHAPAKLFMNTGSSMNGRPSMGAWVTYGIGSESRDLPGFVVLQSGPRGPRGGAANWASGFLPTNFQGVPFRNTGDPIVNLSSPKGITSATQGATVTTDKLDYPPFSDVYIETSGGASPVKCHGHSKRDALEMKRLIEQFQSTYYRQQPPTPLPPVPQNGTRR